MFDLLREWFNQEGGQDLTEYALIIALCIIATVAAVTLYGDVIMGWLNSATKILRGIFCPC